METQVKRIVSEFNQELKLKGFNVFRIEDDSESTRTYSRKDFYKICLTTGKSVIHYADRSFEADDTVLFLGNPNIPRKWVSTYRFETRLAPLKIPQRSFATTQSAYKTDSY